MKNEINMTKDELIKKILRYDLTDDEKKSFW